MNDPVLRVLVSRQSLIDEGYPKSLLLSGAAHATSFFAVMILALLSPKPPIINVIDGFAIPLPRGGAMPRNAEPAEATEEAAPAAPVEVLKPVSEAPAPVKLIRPEQVAPRKGLPPVDLKRSVREPRKPESREIATERLAPQPPRNATAHASGAGNAASGLDFTAQTPGVINGVSGPAGPLGFYLAAAQNKIWATWSRQIRPDFSGNVKVAFTIHRDGSVDQVEVIESSGASALDRLAERAVLSTQLGPLPNAYEKETLVVHANFKPIS